MILIITNKRDYTADYLILELQKRKAEYVRLNTEDFPQNVKIAWGIDEAGIEGYISFLKRRVNLKDIQSVWYRRPVPAIPDTRFQDPTVQEFIVAESQSTLEGLWRCLDCFWVSRPDNLIRAEYKLYQLKIARELGFQIPPTIVTNDKDPAQDFFASCNNQVVYKPLRRGRIIRGDRVSLIYSNPVMPEEASSLDNLVYAPSLFQKYVPKHVEIRVTVIGREIFAVELHSQENADSRHDWRRGDTTLLRHEVHHLPIEIKSKCINLIEKLCLEFGAIDLILTPYNEYVFLEINPNGQWAWIQQTIHEIPLRETLAELLINGGNVNDS